MLLLDFLVFFIVIIVVIHFFFVVIHIQNATVFHNQTKGNVSKDKKKKSTGKSKLSLDDLLL